MEGLNLFSFTFFFNVLSPYLSRGDAIFVFFFTCWVPATRPGEGDDF